MSILHWQGWQCSTCCRVDLTALVQRLPELQALWLWTSSTFMPYVSARAIVVDWSRPPCHHSRNGCWQTCLLLGVRAMHLFCQPLCLFSQSRAADPSHTSYRIRRASHVVLLLAACMMQRIVSGLCTASQDVGQNRVTDIVSITPVLIAMRCWRLSFGASDLDSVGAGSGVQACMGVQTCMPGTLFG